jgi:hypothetical protein
MAHPVPPPRKNIGARIRADLADELRSFVRDNAGKPLFLTVTSFLEDAITAHLEQCQRQIDNEEFVLPGRNGERRIKDDP